MADDTELHKGDQVTWHTHGTTTNGTVEEKITSDTEAAGRTVRADDDDPQYLVKSAKSGREAVHKPAALDKERHERARLGSGRRQGRRCTSQGRRQAGRRFGRGRRPAGDGQQAVPGAADGGLICYGVVHILIGWIALQIAWSGRGESQEASQKGALAELAGQPFGAALLWIVVVGLFALTIWQGIEAIWGHRDRPAGIKRIRKQLGSAGRAVSYAVIAIAAISTAAGSASSGDSSEESLSARLMSNTFGRLLVIAIGITIIVLGVRLIRRGIKKKFTEDLAGGVEPECRPARPGRLHRQGHRLRHRRRAVRLGGYHL